MISSHWRTTSSGPFARAVIGVQLVLRFGWIRCVVVKGSPATRQPACTARHQARYPASYTKPPVEGPDCASCFPAAFRPPAFASWASCSRHGFRFPYGRPTTTHTGDGPDGVSTFHTHETRPGRAPPYPGSDGVHATVAECSVAACRFSTARPSSSWHHHPTQEVAVTRHQRWFTHVRPFGLPLACGPPVGAGRPWAFPRASHPAITGHARQGRDRSWTLTEVTSSTSRRTSNQRTSHNVRPRVATPSGRVARPRRALRQCQDVAEAGISVHHWDAVRRDSEVHFPCLLEPSRDNP